MKQFLAMMALLLCACSAVGDTSSHGSTAGLDGTSWQLVKFEGGDGTVLTPDVKGKYTIHFEKDGRFNMRVDCNRGMGTWLSPGPNQVQFGRLAMTRAMCPPDPLNDRIIKDWEFLRSYVVKEGRLFLALMADGGIYTFEPIASGELRK